MSDMSFEGAHAETPSPIALPPRVEARKEVPRSPNYFKRLGAGLGLVAVLGGTWFVGDKANSYEQGQRNKKLASFQAIEETQIGNARKVPVKLSQNVILLEAGVVYRDTPFSINDSKHFGFISLKGNVAGKVAERQEQVVTKPEVYTDQLNNTWLGFTFTDGKSSKATKSTAEVASDMVWVNASKLGPDDAKIVSRKSDRSLPFSVATVLEHLQESTLDDHGQFMSEAGNPIAWAPETLTFEIAHRAELA
ncbi:MAG: hypothetical protein JWO41_425 [Candidatus Saccharibacteria bacterium]|nr:hypothetical protein [Candidatus Saccharibacteria bacterium]